MSKGKRRVKPTPPKTPRPPRIGPTLKGGPSDEPSEAANQPEWG